MLFFQLHCTEENHQELCRYIIIKFMVFTNNFFVILPVCLPIESAVHREGAGHRRRCQCTNPPCPNRPSPHA